MLLKKGQLPILIVNAIALAAFTILFASRKNYEFIMYIAGKKQTEESFFHASILFL